MAKTGLVYTAPWALGGASTWFHIAVSLTGESWGCCVLTGAFSSLFAGFAECWTR